MTATPTLDAIARPGGGFAMVAMDQRESLRAMFDAAGAGRPDDEVLIRFKLDVAEALGDLASGFLIDRHYGVDRVRDGRILPADDGLILAADALQQEDGGPVEETELDDVVVGATPAELDAGTWDLDEAIREAARELSPLRPSLYKAQVPMSGAGTPAEQQAASEALGAAIQGPWVVLSQGVERDRFQDAVQAACRAGASGFLAGRALWSDVVGASDTPARLRELSRPRLERLIEVVDASARPWTEA